LLNYIHIVEIPTNMGANSYNLKQSKIVNYAALAFFNDQYDIT